MKLFTSIALAALLCGGSASAQVMVKKGPIVEPETNLSPQDWLNFMSGHVALGLYSNRPEVMVFNATPNPVTIKCDESSYDLVGPNEYFKGNPQAIPAWSIAPIDVKGWDSYCKGEGSLKGFSTLGTQVYPGVMEKKGDFSHSRWLAIEAK